MRATEDLVALRVGSAPGEYDHGGRIAGRRRRSDDGVRAHVGTRAAGLADLVQRVPGCLDVPPQRLEALIGLVVGSQVAVPRQVHQVLHVDVAQIVGQGNHTPRSCASES